MAESIRCVVCVTQKCVTVKELPKCGRFLEVSGESCNGLTTKQRALTRTQATTTIRAGQVIATEDPFACVLNEQYRLTHCSCCFKQTSAIFPSVHLCNRH